MVIQNTINLGDDLIMLQNDAKDKIFTNLALLQSEISLSGNNSSDPTTQA